MRKEIPSHIFVIAAIVIAMVPLFFSVASTTDWGSDFALYIHQAENIITGVPQTNNGFIINPNCIEISPQAYPIGFPLFLSLIYKIFGFDISAFVIFQTVLLSGAGLVFFFLFRRKLGGLIALFGLVIILYSPYFMWFRNHILSEYFFLLVLSLLLYFYWYQKRRKYWWVLGVLLGLALSIKGVILPILMGILFYELRGFVAVLRSPSLKKFFVLKFRYWTSVVLTGMGLYILLNYILFSTATGTSFHLSIYGDANPGDFLMKNIYYYAKEFKYAIYEYWHIEWIGFLGLVSSIILIVIGWNKLEGRERSSYYILMFFLASIFLFPHQQGMRYLIPVVPILLFIVLRGTQELALKSIKFKVLLLILGVAFAYSSIQGTLRFNKFVEIPHEWGPYTESTAASWEYIKNYTHDSAIFVSAFPRVLSLYTKRSAFNPCVVPPEQIALSINNYNASFIYLNTQTNPWVPALKDYISTYQSQLDTIFQNEEVTILSIDKQIKK